MGYTLVYTRRAVRDIEALDTMAKERLKQALERFIRDPFAHALRLPPPNIGQYRFRVGDYRVVFDRVGHEIGILRVGHRSEIYDR